MNVKVERSEEQEKKFARAVKLSLFSLPLYVAVPVLFWVGFEAAGYAMDWKAFGLGALGWVIALMLRGPISAAVMKLPKERGKNIVVLSSGVLEESVRLILLALTSFAVSWSVSVGQGWAAVEVLFVMVNIAVIASLANRTDEKAIQAKQMLEANGNVQASPLWGVLERIWASAFHIGCTLIVAANPWTVIVLIPLHSALNWFAGRLGSRSMQLANLLIAVVGIAALIVGLVTVS